MIQLLIVNLKIIYFCHETLNIIYKINFFFFYSWLNLLTHVVWNIINAIKKYEN